MRLLTRNLAAEVSTDPAANRPITLRFAGLHVVMTAAEARALADELHDAAERSAP
ncbi:hypothetical protein C8E05_3816 [Rhodococcus wratislaviensis]|uniref:Uncharacterized protein n=1 Tax=Rhodococcus wratislaviensis TaxID=44752 RepID=A0AB38FLT2_RHOWR|nr:hypothetical protein [Rhodococcus wratislaviensis]REE74381.1 hypothetical protein C8E05_3816 [Rhodococcus wratislaviensis]SPZ42082.1 Uncharacterised protein [Rhodococcus wratislaviensis]